MSARNYVVSPANKFINCSIAAGDVFCGDNGQCIKLDCQEWIGGDPCYPELVRDDVHGFAICPRCGASYGRDAMTGEEYRSEVKR
jgi:hypothetical protein